MNSVSNPAITRSNPDIGYLGAEVFQTFAFSQSVRAGGLVHYAGVAPLRGSLENLELVGAGDMKAQFEFILHVIDDLLKADGLSRKHLVSWTFYTTKIGAFMDVVPTVLKPWVGADAPCSTTIEVSGFVHPEQMLEITAVALAA
jgi:enamine deaminase RidA (YjgF/YER057c/UK114 family)